MRSVYVTVLLVACGPSSDDRDPPDAAVMAPGAPPPLYSVGGAFDSGLPLEGLADSWEWDGASWRRVDDGSGAGPGARDHVSMAYDVGLASVVMCGGAAGATTHPFDAWGWNGAAWSKLSDAAPHVVQSVMVTDAARRRVLLYGGFVPGGSPKNELWQWSAGSWARL